MKQLINKLIKRIWIIIIVIAAIFAGYQCLSERNVPMDSFLAFCTEPEGNSIVSWNDEGKTVVAKVSLDGRITKKYTFQTEKEDYLYLIQGIAAGEDYVYILRNRADKFNGTVLGQELIVVDFNDSLIAKEKKCFELDNVDNYQFRWVHATADTVTLIGNNPYETSAIRQTYEFGTILENTLNLKNTRIYPMKDGEGIYKAIANSTNLVYISDSGKIYCANENDVWEVYPARKLDVLMYPSYISYAESGYIYLGEHETGDIIKLNLSDGSEEVVWNGKSSFFGTGLYTPKDVVEMSMSSLNNFTALVRNSQNDAFQFLIVKDGEAHIISTLHQSKLELLRIFILALMTYMLIEAIIYMTIKIFVSSIRGGYTIMERLITAAIPMLVVTMLLFGFVSYSYYGEAIDENFKKQTMDEGNMLAALFGQESFNEIEYPYDYTGEAYNYLSQQIQTRDLYTRAVYYENGSLYIGVDKNNPCFYPFDIMMNIDAERLYEKAALTGEAVTGTIQDRFGERYVCITPIGGLSGQTIYLLETGVYSANVDAYTATYIKDFAAMSIAFLIIVAVVLMIVFYRILSPIGELKREMQKFADGDRSIRIHNASEDELTGITHVFNKMADDIDVQILNLERMGRTYYRFVPPSIIELLGEDNLGALKLGSNVKGDCAILNVRLSIPSTTSFEKTEILINRFFNTVNQFAKQNNIISIIDDANLQSIIMICKQGVDTAISTALSILTKIDSDNLKNEPNERLKVNFVMDWSSVYFGICGDEERYIPVVLAPKFEKIMSNHYFIKSMGSRFLVTEEAYKEIKNKQDYSIRYLGRLKSVELDIGMYDIYENSEKLRVMKATQHAFDKAIELYEDGLYYEAKNLFAMVLRENQQDMAAKYYVFRCESLDKKN